MATDDDLLFDRADEPESAPPGPRFPVLATVAGVIWILAGALALVNFVLMLADAGKQPAGKGGPGSPCCALGLALGIISAGYKTYTGKAKTLTGYGVASILLGLLAFALAGAIANAPNVGPANPAERLGIVILGGFLGAFGYILPGILALVARGSYLRWREQNTESDDRPRRRGRRPEPEDGFDERDDRPRRRRE